MANTVTKCCLVAFQFKGIQELLINTIIYINLQADSVGVWDEDKDQFHWI